MAKRFLSNIRINDAYTFPASDGTNNQVIKTDGSGNLSFGQLAADSASVMYKDTFTGDGSTSVFSLANALNDEVQSNVYIDGVYQSKSTYSVSGTAITFSTAPLSGHEIEVISTTGINSGPTAIYTDTFTANGSSTAFTLGQTVHSENQTIVFLNGVYQFKGTYTLSGTTLTLDTAPSNGVSIEVMSIGSAYSGGDILYDHDFTSAGLMTSNGSGVYSITANNSANWNTAYGWGDHGLSAQDKTDIGNLSGTNTGDQDLSSYATQSYVGTQISNLVDSSPATLNTLNELAAALGDDPNFATTTANSIGTKLPLAGGTLTGALLIQQSSTSTGFTTEKTGGTGSFINLKDTAGSVFIGGVNSEFVIQTPSGSYSNKLTISNSGNATFTGEVTISAETQYLNFKKASTADILSTIVSETDAGTGGKLRFLTKRNGDTQVNALILDDNQNATFAGNVNVPYGKGYFMDTTGAVGSNFVKTINDYETVIGTDRGSAGFAVVGNSNIRIGFGQAYTAAQTKLFINSSGDVGIGTDSPSYKLEVNGGTSLVGGGFYVSSDQSVSTNFTYTFRDGVGINNPNSISATPNAGYTMCIGRSNNGAGVSGSLSAVGTIKATAFTVNTDTTAGIGASNGDVNAAEVGPGYLNLSRDDTGGAQQIRFEKNGALHSYIETTTSGLNIGNANVYLAKSTNQGQLFFGTADNQYEIFGGGNWGYMGYNTSGYHRFFGSGTERMRITNAGLVGIGATSPGRGLTIDKNGANAALEIIKKNTTNQIVYLGTGSSGGTDDPLLRMFHNTTENIRLYTTGDSWINGGNVGIGTTTPSSLLTLNKATGEVGILLEGNGTDVAKFKLSSAGVNHAVQIGSVSNNEVQFHTNNSEKMRLAANGNVGIGETSPVAQLDVLLHHGSGAFNKDCGARIGRIQYGWHTGQYYANNNYAYVHYKTNLWMGGSQTNSSGYSGNSHYIMGGFYIKSYGYGGGVGEGRGEIKFHNWSGGFASLYVNNYGNWGTFVQSPYTSSDGFCVIVLRHNYYSTPNIDFHQSFTAYPWRNVQVTASTQSNNTTGHY